ncbi:17815_t:CDS:2 [Acaulospora morrowiae]|uniref:Mediator of RNA polymerase II transcription subunit 21 n=1 Tax=Acaulospora morrowiae TaxID=94023 RepID=A0A9N8V5F5_9GLOM|nr:17815_t:CDS:2 [Acaulospora morrowiae]
MPNSLPSPPRPETLREATSINMDRITQLQQSIDRMVSIFLTVVDKLNNTNLQTQDPQKFKSEQQEIVHDICTNAKQIELLIAALPGINRSESEQIATFKALEQELQEANEEYQRSIQNAESLLKQILDTISIIAKDQSSSTFE